MNWKLSGDYFVLPSDEEMDQRMNTKDMEGTRLFLFCFSFRGGDCTTRRRRNFASF